MEWNGKPASCQILQKSIEEGGFMFGAILYPSFHHLWLLFCLCGGLSFVVWRSLSKDYGRESLEYNSLCDSFIIKQKLL